MASQEARTRLGSLINGRRKGLTLTIPELAASSGVSKSHIGRIERGERFPSASVLRKLAAPLSFGENDLFALAGFLPQPSPSEMDLRAGFPPGLDAFVAIRLAEQPVEVQRALIAVLAVLEIVAKPAREKQ